MRKTHAVLGSVGVGLSAVGTVVAVASDAWWGVPVGLAVHLAGAFFATRSARCRRERPLDESERDLVMVLAAVVPVFGPAAACRLARGDEDSNETAHEVIERYMEHVKPTIPAYERTLFTGDHDRDLARKLDAQSFLEVLGHGETDQKRSALQRLADLGEPHHLALVRRCLEDPDHEVRLYAYGELDRLTRRFEGRIAEGLKLESEEPSSAEPKKALARTHADLAGSGVLDAPTAGFHYRASVRYAVAARGVAPDDVETFVLEAVAHARQGDLDEAERCLEEVPSDQVERVDVMLAHAEVAFRRRDFASARVAAGRLLMEDMELPGWLASLVVAGTPVIEEPEDESDLEATGEFEEVEVAP